MLTSDTLREEIVQARFDYGWILYEKYGLKTGTPPLLESNGKSLEETAISLLPEEHPEGFDIKSELERDLGYFQDIVEKRYDPGFRSERLGRINQSIHIRGHRINALHLALCGILTDSATEEMLTKKRNVKGQKSMKELARVLGVMRDTIFRNYDYENRLLFGKYPRKGNVFEKRHVSMMAREAEYSVLFGELVRHLEARYSAGEAVSARVYEFGRCPGKVISPDDQYHPYPYQVYELFNSYPAMDLPSLNAFMNVVLRDQRILDTHLSLEKAARRLGLKERGIRGVIQKKELKTRRPSILNRKSPLISQYDLSPRLREKDNLKLEQIREMVERAGISSRRLRDYSYLRAKGFVGDALKRLQTAVPVEEVSALIRIMREEGLFSYAFKRYCKSNGLRPEDDESMQRYVSENGQSSGSD